MHIHKIVVLALLLIISSSAYGQELRVTQADFATAVENRKPVNVDSTFSADVGTIYFYSVIEGAQDTTTISHVWYYKEEEKARINLQVKSSSWRTWSSKTILEKWTGPWRVMIEDANGNVLATKSFTIQEN